MIFLDRETVERIRWEYPAGTLVELISMNDLQSPPVGTIGEILAVDDTGSLIMRWRNGSGLNLVFDGGDRVRKVTADD